MIDDELKPKNIGLLMFSDGPLSKKEVRSFWISKHEWI